MMDVNITLASETIPNEHLDALSDWIKTYPKLTKGLQTKEFEDLFSQYIETKYSRLVNSGSSANLLMAAANLHYGHLRNKNVAIPSVSWSTTLSPFIQLGYKPYLVDCDPKDLGINVDQTYELAKNNDISTIMVVHVLGHNSSIEKVIDIANEFDIRLFEDSCEALGSTFSGKKLGSFGLASSFSFYYGHHISTIEGGAVCTDNEEFSEILSCLRSHGWGRDLDYKNAKSLKEKYNISLFRDLYSFYFPGFNLRSTEISAYLGKCQLGLINDYCLKREECFRIYKENLNRYWYQESSTEFLSSFAYGTFVENPDEVWEYLQSKGIESRPLICGSLGLQPFWREFNSSYTSLLLADQVHKYGIYLPIHADLSVQEINYVCEVFQRIAVPYKLIV